MSNGFGAPREQGAHLLRSFRQAAEVLDPERPVVALFDGNLSSTYLLHWLLGAGFRKVRAVYVELGDEDRGRRARRLAEALRCELRVLDGREVFAEEFVTAAIRAQAVYLDTYPLSASLSTPLVARLAMEAAEQAGATAVVHGARRSSNSLRRLNGSFELLGFQGWFGSPYDLDPVDGAQKSQVLHEAGLVPADDGAVSEDSNLWCRWFRAGFLEDAEDHAAPDHLYRWSQRRAGFSEDRVELRFERGVPVAVDHLPMPLTALIAVLNERAGAYGIGRYSGVEELAGGEKVFSVREMPAAGLLLRTYRHLEASVLLAETIREKLRLEQVWVREAVEGRWFGELRTAAQTFVEHCGRAVTGTVLWKLSAAGAQTQAIRADRPRHLRDRSAWEHASIHQECAGCAVR